MRLEVRNVTKTLGRTNVLRDVSITVSAGELLCVVGPSGSGKSTLLSIVGGLLSADSGTAALTDGSASLRTRANSTWVTQGNNFLPHRSALENVAIGALAVGQSAGQSRRSATALLDRFGLAGLAERRAWTVSGGELQRIGVARALASGAPLVLADEPTGQLDRVASLSVAEAFKEAAEMGRIVVIATHDERVAAYGKVHLLER